MGWCEGCWVTKDIPVHSSLQFTTDVKIDSEANGGHTSVTTTTVMLQ